MKVSKREDFAIIFMTHLARQVSRDFLPLTAVAGKTGTAQNPHGESHAWFIGFAPFDKPEVAVCVFVENGGGGGAVAAPLAGEMLKAYFRQKDTLTAAL